MTEHDPRCEAGDGGDQKLLDDVAEYGWHVVGVLEDGELPGWAYSIGLYHTFNHPEIIVFGLDPNVAHSLINTVGEDARAGRRYEADDLYAELVADYLCTFKPVVRDSYRPLLAFAEWFYEGREYPALQCFWPDPGSRFPWDPDFDPDWLWAQPLLFHADPVEAGAVELLTPIDP